MGCYPPLGKIVSKALGKCNGRERWREGRLDFDYALAYPPGPPPETHYMRPVARTVTFASNNSIYVIPPSPPQPQQQPQPQPQPQPQSTPEPQQQQPQTPPRHEPEQHHETPESQPPQPPQAEPPEPPPAQTQDAAPPQAEPKPPTKGPKRGKKKQPGRVRFGPEPPTPPQQQEEQQAPQQQEHAQGPGNIEKSAPDDQGPHGHFGAPAPGQGQGQGYLVRYTPSPLPRWEATPRRHEYFSGEYRSYYPTPVREGIYRIATDANRLTTIFSEENPNACTIV